MADKRSASKREERKVRDAFENDVPIDRLRLDYGDESVESAGATPAQLPVRKKTVERLAPGEMLPDRLQPRPPLLPLDVRARFFAGEIDCYQAAREWMERARDDPAMQRRVDGLLATGSGMQAHGQINPITGAYWTPPWRDRPVFVIETGERRFWAAVLNAVLSQAEREPELEVTVMERPSPMRQVIENIQMEEPSAVGKACEIAALVLAELRVDRDWTVADAFDHSRQALVLPSGRRLPAGTWQRIEQVMQLSPRRMRQMLSILHLPTPLLLRADLHDIPDRVLRAIVAEPPENWEALLNAAIEHQLTSEEVVELPELSAAETASIAAGVEVVRRAHSKAPAARAFRGVRGFIRAFSRVEESDEEERLLGELATDLALQKDAGTTLHLLERLTALLRVRVGARTARSKR